VHPEWTPALKATFDRLRRSLNRTVTRGAVYTFAVAAFAVFALPGAAMADDDYYKFCPQSWASCQTGVAAGLVEGNCMTSSAGYASTQMCVKYDGDYVYVYDGRKDGYAAMAYIKTEDGSVTDRYCRNNLGYGNWAVCNFDWAESGKHEAASGYKADYYNLITQSLWTWSGN
jgi:hypothetical protein